MTPSRETPATRPLWVALLVAGGCAGGGGESPPADTTPPTVQASPAAGSYADTVTVALLCADAGSGCAVVRYTVDGSAPTASSAAYAGPIPVSATGQLRYFAIDNAGNESAAKDDHYLIDRDGPAVSATPPGGVFSTGQTVTLVCQDGGGSGCAGLRYTLDGTPPGVGSPLYTAPLSVVGDTTVRFVGIDAVGNAGPEGLESYVIVDPSAQLAAIRGTPDGAIGISVLGALVTYVRPLVGADPAGFYLQAHPAGPAVFVAVDPASLPVAPAVGDRVSLVATERTTVSGTVEVTAISDLAVLSTGEPVEPLRADVSAVDLPPAVDDYESELVSLSGTVAGPFGARGAGFVGAALSTAGTPGAWNLWVRLPTALQASTGLAEGCAVQVRVPLGRFDWQVQATAWSADDLSVEGCPAPRLTGAIATSATAVTLTFDRQLDPASVASYGSQVTLSGGIAATSAAVSGTTLLVATTSQTPGLTYTVSVAGTVRDLLGAGVDPAAAEVTFLGFMPQAVLRLTEVAPNAAGGRDLVELVVLQTGTAGGVTVLQDGATLLATLPDVLVTQGEVIVVHLNPDAGVTDAPGPETSSRSQHPSATYTSNYDAAWDFHGGSAGLTFSNRVISVKDRAGVTQDGAAFANPAVGSPPSGFPAALLQLQGDAHWLPSTCGGVACTYVSIPTAVQISVDWSSSSGRTITARRLDASTDTNQAADWTAGAASLGAP